jgi:hypothetical protein
MVSDLPVKFLRLILPDRGHYIAAVKLAKGKGFKPNSFASSIEELWNMIENADRDGHEVYHACASFKEARNDPQGTPDGQKQFGRTKRNALGAKAFWLDPDAGKDKPYRDQDAALEALADFCRASGLPAPIVLTSGSGLHVYWPLQHMLDPETWTRYARGLKNLCAKLGLHADPTRTADISSVLRTPGTHNRKGGVARVVECDPRFLEIEPYPIERFEILLEYADVERPAKRANAAPLVFSKLPERLRGRRTHRAKLAEALTAFHETADGLLIAEHCEQVRALRDSKGCLPEPRWYAALGVLAFCEDGDALAHEWSSGDARYTEIETQERLDRARTLTGATTCEHFHSLNRNPCEGCKHWGKIKSPIVLGKFQAADAQADASAAAIASSLKWEYMRGGALKPKSYLNTESAIAELGIKGRHDVFHDRKIIEGDVIENMGPQLSDAICRAMRELIIHKKDFDPGLENVQQALERRCEANRFDPVLDYLDSLCWDGHPRLDRWIVTYMAAADTELNRAIGQLSLVAMVRRARQPGCKFDQIIVLEGTEGTLKSTALLVLAGSDENFSDQTILGRNDKEQQELLRGKWVYEIADLSNMRKTEVEHVKAFASRTHDRGRPAYGRHVTDQPRRCVIFATTNDQAYLKSQTGNRRFWPVKTGRIDIDALRRDRDKLFAEAAVVEASGVSLGLPEHLWGAARAEQEKRQEDDPWDDLLADVEGEVHPAADGRFEERVASECLLFRLGFGLVPGKASDRDAKRLGHCMRRLGWSGPAAKRIQGKLVKGYSRPTTKQPKDSDPSTGNKTAPRPVTPGGGSNNSPQ